MTRFTVSPDGGDPTLFSELGNHPLPVVSKSQLTLPSYWGPLVAAVLAGQAAAEAAEADAFLAARASAVPLCACGLSGDGRGPCPFCQKDALLAGAAALNDEPCGQCGHDRWLHDDGCRHELFRPDACECVRFDGPQP